MKKKFALWGLSLCLMLLAVGCHRGYDKKLASEYAAKCQSGTNLSDEDISIMIEIYKEGAEELLDAVHMNESDNNVKEASSEQYQDLMIIAGMLTRKSRDMSIENHKRFMEVNEEIGRKYREIMNESANKK